MSLRLLKIIAATLGICDLFVPRLSWGGSIKAFSLREANRLLAEGAADNQELRALGGMTRLAGMVFDRDGGDVILIGKARYDMPPVSLDDLVVALRARLGRGRYPKVSIDMVEQTRQTGMQQVRFEGGIEKTRFGEDFVNSDIYLKRYSLHLLQTIEGIDPYLKLYEDAAKKEMAEQGHPVQTLAWLSEQDSQKVVADFIGKQSQPGKTVQSRFWFYPREDESFIVGKDDVYTIEELRLGVRTEPIAPAGMGGAANPPPKDDVGELFAAQFTEHFRKVCDEHPAVNRLKALFDLVCIAEGIAELGTGRPDLAHLINHQVEAVETHEKYPLLNRVAKLQAQGEATMLVQLSGGIDMETILLALEDGDTTALKMVVLETRPNPRSLCWTLPLDQWEMPNDERSGGIAGRTAGSANGSEPDKVGFALNAQSYLFGTAGARAAGIRFQGFLPPSAVSPMAVPDPKFRRLDRLRRRARRVPVRPDLVDADVDPGLLLRLPPVPSFYGSNPRQEPIVFRRELSWPWAWGGPFGINPDRLVWPSVNMTPYAQTRPPLHPWSRAAAITAQFEQLANAWQPMMGTGEPTWGPSALSPLGRLMNDPILADLFPTRKAELGARFATSPLIPATVGGVYLGGASKGLGDLGMLEGIGVDPASGRLLLLAAGKSPIKLPPLRLDDVVTIFRSVYLYGEAPMVSIDPNPNDPQGPTMHVRHGQATADTYVGWVLFEADRVMKGYSLGRDNVSRQPMQTHVEGYRNLLDLGLSNFSQRDGEPSWERFWIVPAEVQRRRSGTGQLTLLDVSLKVDTEPMELRDGKLVSAKDKKPSKEADTFARWLTEHYDEVAREAKSKAPGGAAQEPVAFFAELRRIAMLTAIAESLRDQGVTMPNWMRDYEVAPCPVPRTTPAIVVQRSKTETSEVVEGAQIKTLKQTWEHRIYGGVQLAVPDEKVHTTKAAPEAERLAPRVVQTAAAVKVLEPVRFEDAGRAYQAVTLPGETTRDLRPCRLEEIDLVVPVRRGTEIRLVRKYHSFFRAEGVLGCGWTMDLPRLEKQPVPLKRTEDRVEARLIHHLTSPLGTWQATFDQTAFVPEANAELQVPRHDRQILGLAAVREERVGRSTAVLLFRNGQQWHFDVETGDLVAVQTGPLLMIYRRETAGRISRIEGWYAKDRLADIGLDYDDAGRLTRARGSNGQEVAYTYTAPKLLKRAAGPAKTVEYRYHNGLLTEVLSGGRPLRRFEYDGQGRLAREQRAGNPPIAYRAQSTPDGIKVEAVGDGGSGKDAVIQSAQYDTAFRPVARAYPDGTKVRWQYAADGAASAIVTPPHGGEYVVRRSAKGDRVSWDFPDGGSYSVDYDEFDRVIEIRRGNQTMATQQWHPNGLLKEIRYPTAAMHAEYNDNLVMTGLLVTPPGQGPTTQQWMHIEYDASGRPVRVSDCTGTETTITYDAAGRPESVVSGQGRTLIRRDEKGRLQTMQTSWGLRWDNRYDPRDQRLAETEIKVGDSSAKVELDGGSPGRVRQLDGGEYRFARYLEGLHAGQLREFQLPNTMRVGFDYDASSRVVGVTYGDVFRQNIRYDDRGRVTEVTRTPMRP